MKKILFLVAAFAVLSTPVHAQGVWEFMQSASDDSTFSAVTPQYIATGAVDTTKIYSLAALPVAVEADGSQGTPLTFAIYFEQTAATVDSIWYAIDYYIADKRVAAGSLTGVANASAAWEIVQAKITTAPAEGFRLRISNQDSGAKDIKQVRVKYVSRIPTATFSSP